MNFRGLIAVTALLIAAPASANDYKTEKGNISVSIVASGLDQPWGLDFLPDGRMIVTEKPGQLRIITLDGKISPPVKGVPRVDDSGQGGLLDITLHPKFKTNRMVFVSFSEQGPGGTSTAMASGRLSADCTALENARTLFSQQPKVPGGRHFGSRVIFAPDGTVFLTTGDRGKRHDAQKLGSHIGKVIRLTAEPGDMDR